MIRSFSVIIPVFNKEREIISTLESVEGSIRYFRENFHTYPVEPEVVIVDDSSTDQTPGLVTAFIQDKAHIRMIHNPVRSNAAIARNNGVAASKGELLFFCDGDDFFLKEHIFIGHQMLDDEPFGKDDGSFTLTTDQGTFIFNRLKRRVACVQTGVLMRDSVDPYWKHAVENTLTQNLCVRRSCHDFIEGFPKWEMPYSRLGGGEDISYRVWLGTIFMTVIVQFESVEYVRYPGNAYDNQLKKFQSPPESPEKQVSAEQLQLHQLREKIEAVHLNYLLEKLKCLDEHRPVLDFVDFECVGKQYAAKMPHREALAVLEQGILREPNNQSLRTLAETIRSNAERLPTQ